MGFLTKGMTIPRRRLLAVTLLSGVETLSESKLRERGLQEHAEKVGKLVRKSEEHDQP